IPAKGVVNIEYATRTRSLHPNFPCIGTAKRSGLTRNPLPAKVTHRGSRGRRLKCAARAGLGLSLDSALSSSLTARELGNRIQQKKFMNPQCIWMLMAMVATCGCAGMQQHLAEPADSGDTKIRLEQTP